MDQMAVATALVIAYVDAHAPLVEALRVARPHIERLATEEARGNRFRKKMGEPPRFVLRDALAQIDGALALA